MLFLARAASLAAVTLCAGLLLGTTTPSFAQELPGSNLPALNALVRTTVPATAESLSTQQPAKLQPAVLQMVQDIPQPTEAVANDVDDDFSSLADAVAAQDGTLSDGEVRCLAAGVYYESKGESLAGQLASAKTQPRPLRD